jgi:hypothetical protein
VAKKVLDSIEVTTDKGALSIKHRNLFFVALSFRPNPSFKMGGADRCGILFYAGSATTGLLLVAPAPIFLPHETISI